MSKPGSKHLLRNLVYRGTYLIRLLYWQTIIRKILERGVKVRLIT